MTTRLESDLSKIAPEQVAIVLRDAPWAANRTTTEISEMLKCTQFAVLAFSDDNNPIGFARAISDNIFRAFIEDVVVTKSRRGEGIGARMIGRLEEAIKARGIPRIELITRQPDFWTCIGYTERQESKYLVKWMNASK